MVRKFYYFWCIRATTFAVTDKKTLCFCCEFLKSMKNEPLAGINVTESKVTPKNQYLDFLTDPSFQGVNRRFVGNKHLMLIQRQ